MCPPFKYQPKFAPLPYVPCYFVIGMFTPISQEQEQYAVLSWHGYHNCDVTNWWDILTPLWPEGTHAEHAICHHVPMTVLHEMFEYIITQALTGMTMFHLFICGSLWPTVPATLFFRRLCYSVMWVFGVFFFLPFVLCLLSFSKTLWSAAFWLFFFFFWVGDVMVVWMIDVPLYSLAFEYVAPSL